VPNITETVERLAPPDPAITDPLVSGNFPAMGLIGTEVSGITAYWQEVSGAAWFVYNALFNGTNWLYVSGGSAQAFRLNSDASIEYLDAVVGVANAVIPWVSEAKFGPGANFAVGGASAVTLAAVQTLINKTLTNPVINALGPSVGQQHTVPAVASDTLVLLVASQTLANKTFSNTVTIALGTISTNVQALNATVVWNNAAVVFTHLKVNITDTASDPASLIFDYQVGGSSKVKADKTGAMTIGGPLTLPADPTLPLQATTKQYVDNTVGSTSISFKDQQTTLVDVTNSTVETTLYAVTLPQNTLLAGRLLVSNVYGDAIIAAGNTLTFKIKLGTTVLISFAAALTATAVRTLSRFRIEIFAIAPNSQYVTGDWYSTTGVNIASGTFVNWAQSAPGTFWNTSTEDNGAGARLFAITATWNVAGLTSSVRALGAKTLVFA